MKKFNLAEYAKPNHEPAKPEPWTTSVVLTQTHRAFLESRKINFSELVRDFLDALIDESKPKS